MSNEIRQVAQSIGEFYLAKHNGDYDKATEEIQKVKFVKLEFLPQQAGHILMVSIARPGLFIGKRGQNVDALEKHLGLKISIREAESIEDFIIPEPPQTKAEREEEERRMAEAYEEMQLLDAMEEESRYFSPHGF